jgi:hypothetical protein
MVLAVVPIAAVLAITKLQAHIQMAYEKADPLKIETMVNHERLQ